MSFKTGLADDLSNRIGESQGGFIHIFDKESPRFQLVNKSVKLVNKLRTQFDANDLQLTAIG